MLERKRDSLIGSIAANGAANGAANRVTNGRQSSPTATASRFPAHFETIRRSVEPSKKFISGAFDLNYGELFDRIDRLSTLFRECGLGVGARVLIASRNDREVAVLFLAMLSTGRTAVVIDPASAPAEASALITAADPAAIFIDAGLADRIVGFDALTGSIKTFTLREDGRGSSVFGRLRLNGGDAPAAAGDYPAVLDRLPASPGGQDPIPDSTTALILFTSGTSSRPKGVQLSHRNLHAQYQTFVSQYGFTERSRILNHLPLHHTDGLNMGPAAALFAAATLHRPAPFSVQTLPTLLAGIRREAITHVITVPTALALIMQVEGDLEDSLAFPDLAFVCSTAGPLDETLWREFEERFGVMVVNSYGLTETVSQALYCGPTPETRKRGTIGKPVDCRARVLDDDGNPVAPGAVGELALCGANIATGYFRDPAASAAAIGDGWLRTGDLVTVDQDGFYRIVGRKKDAIVRGGIDVSPQQVTETILALAGVREAVTFGMADPTLGERVVSCLTQDDAVEVSAAAVFAHCRAQMSPEKVPSEVHVLEGLPTGPAGEVSVSELRTIVAERVDRNLERGGLTAEARVLAIAAATFAIPVDRLAPASAHDTTSAWTPRAHVAFIQALEENFAVTLTAREIKRIETLDDAIGIVKAKLDSP